MSLKIDVQEDDWQAAERRINEIELERNYDQYTVKRENDELFSISHEGIIVLYNEHPFYVVRFLWEKGIHA